MPTRFPELDGVFRNRVYEIVRLVPWGQVTTYGFVSTLAGMPRHARQVGWALHSLPERLVWGASGDVRHAAGRRHTDRTDAAQEEAAGKVPWHRVVNARGEVSTHPDEAGTYRQIELLREEGIQVTDDGVLVKGLAAHLWRPEPATVEQLELPLDALFAVDKLLDQ